MIIDIHISDLSKATIAKYAGLGDKITAALRDGLRNAMTETQGFIMRDLLSAPEISDSKLVTRTGSLKRALMTVTWTEPNVIGGAIVMSKGPADKYAAMLEEGGTIRPKKGKYLAVPLPAARTPSGVMKGKYNVSDLRQLKLACFRSKLGNLILAERRKRGKSLPLFVLKPFVTIRGRHYMAQGRTHLAERVIPTINEELAKAVA